jgi:hypothetical protein
MSEPTHTQTGDVRKVVEDLRQWAKISFATEQAKAAIMECANIVERELLASAAPMPEPTGADEIIEIDENGKVHGDPSILAKFPKRTPLSDAEIMLRDRWKGDLDRIPLGKVVEFMQSYALAAQPGQKGERK